MLYVCRRNNEFGYGRYKIEIYQNMCIEENFQNWIKVIITLIFSIKISVHTTQFNAVYELTNQFSS